MLIKGTTFVAAANCAAVFGAILPGSKARNL